jgi:hypothetical protein
MSETETMIPTKCVCCNREGTMPKAAAEQSYCCAECVNHIVQFFIFQVAPFCIELINDRSEKKEV